MQTRTKSAVLQGVTGSGLTFGHELCLTKPRVLESIHGPADGLGRHAESGCYLRHGEGGRQVRACHGFVSVSESGLIFGKGKRDGTALSLHRFHKLFRTLQLLILRHESVIAEKHLVADSLERIGLIEASNDKSLISADGRLVRIAEVTQQPIAIEPGRRTSFTCQVKIAAPFPGVQRRHYLCAQRIQNDVTGQFQKIALLLHQNGFVTSLKKMSDELMSPIEMLGVYAVKLAHGLRQIPLHCFDQQVVVISHLTKTVDDAVVPFAHKR